MISRRSVLKHLPTLGAAVAVPVIAAIAEHPEYKVRRLGKELSAALAELGSPMQAKVYPPNHEYPVIIGDIAAKERWLEEARQAMLVKAHFDRIEGMPADHRVNHHVQGLRQALFEITPGRWNTLVDPEFQSVALVLPARDRFA